jgi:hypothetical protein
MNGGKKDLKQLNQGKDEKQKKRFDSWGYRLAWLGFASVLLAAFYKLIKSTDAPKKNDYYI